MNRLTFLFLLFFIACHLHAGAQIPNSGFEQLNAGGMIGHWGKEYSFPTWIDLSGQVHTDSVVVDRAFYFPTTDAHSGAYALEMHNGYNYTAKAGIAGAAILVRNAYEYSPFGRMLPVTERPTQLGFHFKFFPAGSDMGFAELLVYDSLGYEIGSAALAIVNEARNYTKVSIPVTYTSNAPAAFISLQFSACMPGAAPTPGTRFLVDDINQLSLGIQGTEHRPLQCYPTVATNELHIQLPDAPTGLSARWMIMTLEGKRISSGTVRTPAGNVDVANLPAGQYLLSVLSGDMRFNGRFSKQ